MSRLRLAGFILVLLAILLGVGDIWTIIVRNESLSLGDVWAGVSKSSLNATQAGIERYLWSGLWWYGLYPILLAPAWLVVAFVGGIMVALGGKDTTA